MSRTIDERVVSMQFDNKQFESNVQTSLSTLDKLKQSLRLDGAAKGFDNIGAAAKSVNMAPLANAVETVRTKFSALEVMAVTALANITNSAVNAGKQLISSLTVDQITAGWDKYGQKTASVQTIMNATGKSIDEVNGYLDKLMWFSDETSYGFTDMTSAIAQLTSAGGDIDKLVPMVTGIANATAYAGKGATEFSRAIYNLNQSYSAGALQYMDWKSLELAGVASKELKQTFIDTALAMGKIKNGEVTIANFGQTLKDKWADTEVMEAAFGKFGEMTEKAYEMVQAGEVETASEAYAKLAEQYDGVSITAAKAAQEAKTFTEAIDATKDAVSSGWMKTFEIVFGNYEEAKVLWTDLANAMWDAFASGAEARNEMLQEWKDLGGRDDLIQSFWNTWEAAGSIITPIKEAFRDIFPPITAQRLADFTKGLKDLTANFKLSEEQAEKVKSIFKGLFSALDIGFTFIKKVGSGIVKLLGNFTGLRDGILNSAGSLGDWISNLRDSIKESDVFGKAVDKVVGFIQNGIDKIKEFGSAVKEKFAAPGFETFLGVITKIWETLKTVGSKIIEIAANIGSAIGNAFRSGDIKSVLDVVNGGIIASILLGIRKYISGITEAFDSSETFIGKIKDLLGTVGDALQAWQQNIQAGTLIKIAAAIGILAASLLVLSLIDPEKLASSLGAITVLFAELMGSLAIFNKMNLNLTGTAKAVTAMIGMSVAILILASAMKKLSSLSWEEIGKGVVGVLGLTTILVAASKIMATEGKKVAKGALQMVIMAAALKILASVCKDLSELSWIELAKGLSGIVVLLAAISLFLNTAKFGGKAVSTATGIVIMAAALKILASVCKDFSTMKWEEIGKGLAGIAGLLLELAGFTNLAGNAKHVLSTGVALIAIAAAMKIFANVMNDMSQMSWEEIAKGLTSMGGALLIVAGAMNLMPDGMVVKAVGLIGIAAAITILGNALTSLGGMSWEEIAKGLVALGSSLGILAGGLYLMNGSLAGSAALIVAALALGVFAPVLKSLGDMSWGQIVKGLVALAGAIAIFGAAAFVLTPVIPVMLGLGAAILIFGAGCALAGVGITAIATGLMTLGAAIVVTASSIVETINTIVKGLGTIITSFCNSIAESAPAIAEAFVAILEATCYAIKESIPLIAETFFELLVEALTLLKTYIPQLVDLLADVLVGLMDGLAERMPDLATSVVNLAQKFVASFAEALMSAFGEVDLGGLLEKLETVSKIFLELSIAAKIISTIPITGALTGVVGLAAVVGGIAAILAILGGLSQIPGFNWLLTEGTRALSQIGTAIGAFVGAIVGNFASGVTSGLPKMAENLSSFMDNIQPFVNGAKNIDASVLEGAGILAATVLCITASDVISSIASFLTGGSSIKRFGEEIAEFGTYLKAFADNTQGVDAEAVKGAASAAKALAEMASIIPNEGGIAALFAGENSLASFGPQLADFGSNLKAFSDNVSGINPENIVAAATAGKALADMANTIPNEGGMVAWFTGENSLANFGPQIATFGSSLKSFSDNVSGINPDNITAAATAGKALADMANTIPNEGGMVAWFTGENSVAKFGSQLIVLGDGLKGFAEATSDINAEHLTAVITAAKALADMTSVIPNEGGMVAWFTGENSISKFGSDLISLGIGLKGFSVVTSDINAEHLTGVIAAAKALSEMTNTIPNEGGMVAWFTGENSISKFGADLISLGIGLKGFSVVTSDINAEHLTGVISAAKALADMTNTIPNEGGMVAWFTGENSISKFGADLITLGMSLKNFAESVTGIKPENCIGAISVAKSIADLSNTIPNSGGVVAWFTGENSISKFSDQLALLGSGLKGFSDSSTGIKSENCTGALSVAKSIVELSNSIPNSGGVVSWFTGETSISKFAGELTTLGAGLKGFSDSVTGIKSENCTGALSVAKSIADLTNAIPNSGGVVSWFTGESSIAKFSGQLRQLGEGLKGFADATSGINAQNAAGAVDVAKKIADMTKSIPAGTNFRNFSTQLPKLGEAIRKFADEVGGIKSSNITSGVTAVKRAMQQLNAAAKDGAEGFAKAFERAKPNVNKAVISLIDAVVSAISKKGSSIAKEFKSILEGVPDDLRGYHTDFYSAGTYLVDGFAQGITDQTFAAEAAASAMASAALEAAKAALGVQSPSKEMAKVGNYSGMGFVNGLIDYTSKAYKAGYGMANKALSGVSNAISRINDVITSDIDTQPTIRPVLDLSDISSGAGAINNMLGLNPSVGMLTNVGAISAMMNRNQNGANDDVISAINNLGRKLSNASGDTYHIDGITYDDGSTVADAVKTLVRAARIERRS